MLPMLMLTLFSEFILKSKFSTQSCISCAFCSMLTKVDFMSCGGFELNDGKPEIDFPSVTPQIRSINSLCIADLISDGHLIVRDNVIIA